ncbi:MarR family winged helix-turn-helix transcriptional regulator [Dictyobacter formicarum]|uniref:Transcriptional regulator n=1 Tax=Dictyobacter formicarum TaxID=2778368 RepID=A0ABQ3VTQ9_9CHLR|nr:MarR family transcriptional regulator [Dictyobacter formicarum]GHO89667.1 transcriptional regulator [Dictyobacter formicarum]
MSEDAGQYDALVQRRQENIGRYFWRAHRAFVALSVRKLAARGHTGLAPAHATLISHLDTEGTRITTLAERMHITKQAAGHLVADLAEKGYIASAADPTDRRAVLITFTEMGWRFLRDAYELKGEIETEFIDILGKERYEQLRETLNDLLTHIEDERDDVK